MSASVKIGPFSLTVEDTLQCNREGCSVYRWSVIRYRPTIAASPRKWLEPPLWEGYDLFGPGRGQEQTDREMLGTFLTFLSTALGSVENADLFPIEMIEEFSNYSDEVSNLELELEHERYILSELLRVSQGNRLLLNENVQVWLRLLDGKVDVYWHNPNYNSNEQGTWSAATLTLEEDREELHDIAQDLLSQVSVN